MWTYPSRTLFMIILIESIHIFSLSVCMHTQSLSCVQLFATLWTVTRQATVSMGFPRQEYESGLLLPTPG